MNKSRDVIYMVNVLDGDRWTIYTDATTKGRGIKKAKELLATRKFDAVKVTEDRGQMQEINVFEEKTNGRRQPVIAVTPVDTAPYCQTLEDFYGFEARLIMGRLFRQYLDQTNLTVSELIYEPFNLRKLMHNEKFYYQAVQSISNLQTKVREEKPAERVKFLETMGHKMTERAQFSRELTDFFEVLKKNHAGILIKEITAKIAEENRDFSIRAVLANYLSNRGDWEGKLLLLIDQVEQAPGDQALAFIDELVAEILDGSAAVQEILGYQRNLAAAMTTMVQLATGTYEIKEGSNSTLERFSAVMARNELKMSQAILIDRVGQTLAGVNPLTKGTREEEQDTFRALMRIMIGQKVFTNSGSLAEAATLRAKSVLREKHEDESYLDAIDGMIFLLPTIATKFGYLLDLTGTDYGRRHQEHIISSLSNVLSGINSVTQIVERGATEKEIIIAAAGMRDRLLATVLPEEWRLRFARKIYDLLVAYQSGDTNTTISVTPETKHRKAEENYSEAEESPVFKTRKTARSSAEKTKPQTPKTDDSLARKELKHGEFIFHEGDVGDEAYLILSGQVNIIRRVGNENIVIAQVGAGSIIGEMALIDSEPRMASARAVVDTVLTVIPSKDLKIRLDRLEKTDPVMRRLVGMFVQRMRDARVISIDS